MTRLNAFAWVDDNEALHIDIPALLSTMRVADTPANRAQLSAWAADYLHEQLPNAEIVKDSNSRN